MELYAGIYLHSNNSVVTVLDEQDRTVCARRLPNDLDAIVSALLACAGSVRGVAVESNFNWYWLVDGLQAAGFTVHLVNTAAVKQYDGLKHSGDFSDARHLAHLLRLGILREWLNSGASPMKQGSRLELLRFDGQADTSA
ncbi:transposase [Variovorax sp. J22R133]|uniref:IS110 family transposase n=1 Tax=Variovorax brevis TaxID=3053503 RepID=UPI002577A127|nr:transposase [Variovorax sp. J22R133]MDM0118114.1 transposase [Variovorax sp. J22R133]